MEKINNLIKNNQADIALKMINEDILNSLYFDTDKYHKLFFAKGIIYIMKYENTKPLNNEFYQEAKEAFEHADNAYRALHGRQCEKYKREINNANTIFVGLNTKKIS
jgi:hypothetical protein